MHPGKWKKKAPASCSTVENIKTFIPILCLRYTSSEMANGSYTVLAVANLQDGVDEALWEVKVALQSPGNGACFLFRSEL